MKILEVNKFYYRRGGAESYLLEIEKQLKREGHEVAVFSMLHPKNNPSVWDKYFVSRLSFNEGNWWDKLRYPFRLFYSLEAKKKFTKLVKDFQPDIIHIHNIYHQISPSILPVAKKYKIPVVMHLHDYKLISPDYQLFSKGKISYRSAAPHYFHCIADRCVGNSLPRSVGAAFEMWLHHSVLKIYEKNIDGYIAPSNFMKETCVRFGVPAEKINVLYNFVMPHQLSTESTDFVRESYVAYVGRLSSEKGIDILLRALPYLPATTKVKIAGEGPLRESLENLTTEVGVVQQVEFMGRLSGQTLEKFIEGAQAIIIPSVWLENMPFSLLEALAKGKIVIASKIGGLPEIIKDGVNGFLFEVGNAKELAETINRLPQANLSMISEQAHHSVEILAIDKHSKKLQEIFALYGA